MACIVCLMNCQLYLKLMNYRYCHIYNECVDQIIQCTVEPPLVSEINYVNCRNDCSIRVFCMNSVYKCVGFIYLNTHRVLIEVQTIGSTGNISIA